jgi:tRNA (guanosine-2'-O-)-methyltransferase
MRTPRTVSRREKVERVLKKKQPDLTLVFENVNNPHNIYAITRTCDSTGILDIYAVYDENQSMPKPQKSGKKSSSSGIKWINIHQYSNVEKCIDKLKEDDFIICCTDLREDSISIYDFDFTQKIALIVGNERYGVSENVAKMSDYNLYIPMIGMIRSLNVSVATAVILYEAFRQRQVAGMFDNQRLLENEYQRLFEEWINK